MPGIALLESETMPRGAVGNAVARRGVEPGWLPEKGDGGVADEMAEFTQRDPEAAETLDKSRKSGIIAFERDPLYDGLSEEDIASRYIKPNGSHLLSKDILELPIETQREIVQGYDKAIELFGDIPPQRIKIGNLGRNVFAKYSPDYRTITVNPANITEIGQAFATMIHEMTHHAENIKLYDSDHVLRIAFQKMGLRSNTKQAVAMKMRTVGSAAGNDHNKPTEVVAYAIERQMTGRGNPLTEAIYAVLKEKGAIK